MSLENLQRKIEKCKVDLGLDFLSETLLKEAEENAKLIRSRNIMLKAIRFGIRKGMEDKNGR